MSHNGPKSLNRTEYDLHVRLEVLPIFSVVEPSPHHPQGSHITENDRCGQRKTSGYRKGISTWHTRPHLRTPTRPIRHRHCAHTAPSTRIVASYKHCHSRTTDPKPSRWPSRRTLPTQSLPQATTLICHHPSVIITILIAIPLLRHSLHFHLPTNLPLPIPSRNLVLAAIP